MTVNWKRAEQRMRNILVLAKLNKLTSREALQGIDMVIAYETRRGATLAEQGDECWLLWDKWAAEDGE